MRVVGRRVVVLGVACAQLVDERRLPPVRGLDWLARFRVEPGSQLEVVDRDGTSVRGRPAAVLVLSRLPLTAWFALPAWLLPAVRRAGRA